MKRVARIILFAFLLFGGGTVFYHYYKQDELIFRNKATPREHVFRSERPFEELYLKTKDGKEVNTLHFKTDHPKGVFYFLHGRGCNLERCITKAPVFLDRGYDVVMIDYRGFGKSSPVSFSEAAFFEDSQLGYDYVKSHYDEKEIVVCGHSLGSSFATWIAANNSPKLLVLEAPFYSMLAAAGYTKPFLPEWILKLMLRHHFRTDKWIVNVKAPIYIFHGTDDRVVPYEHALKLVDRIKQSNRPIEVELFIVPGWGHQDIHKHSSYRKFFHTVLSSEKGKKKHLELVEDKE